jgi:ribosomal protein L11 methylase PrmA
LASTTYPALDLRFTPGPGAGSLQDFLYAELDAFEPVAIHEHETGDGWRVFFRTRAQRDGAHAALMSEFRNALVDLSAIDVDDEDWARRSQADLKAVRVGRIVVAPPWDVPDGAGAPGDVPDSETAGPSGSRAPGPSVELPDIVIIIEPSMGFGTGHHATTRLCLELVQQIDLRGRRVIDVGTGSGVLAIAAAKLGASSVVAVDNDPDALLNARENMTRNQATGIDVREGDVAALSVAAADVILANLTAAVLQRAAGSLVRLMKPGGTAIVSGFAPDELSAVAAAFGAPVIPVIKVVREGDWAAASLQV